MTQTLLIISNVILLLLLPETVRRLLRYKFWLRRFEVRFDSPIPAVRVEDFVCLRQTSKVHV